MKRKIFDQKELLVSVALITIVWGLYAPFELYAVNKKELWFSLKDFWYMPVACSGMMFIGLFLFGCLLHGKILAVYNGLLSGLGIAAWLQANIGFLKLGPMDGHTINWTSYYLEFCVDGFLWLFCIAVCIWINLSEGKKHKVSIVLPAFLSAMLMLTLVFLLVPCLAEDKAAPYGYATGKELLNVSGQGDIIVFLVDMVDEDYWEQVMQEAPDIVDGLDGFTYYSNMAACYDKTVFSLPVLMSGKYCRTAEPDNAVNILCDDGTFLESLVEKGYEFGFYTTDDLVPDTMKMYANNYEKADFIISDKKRFLVTLYRLVLCQYAPDVIKPYVWLQGYEFETRKKLDSDYTCWRPDNNLVLLDAMEGKQLQADGGKPQYKFIHVGGSHSPYNDEYGQRIEGETDVITCTKGVFRLVLQYLEQMKELDVYDSSSIIIMADHGAHGADPSSPCFIVKPSNTRGKLTENSAPVSHIDFGATVLELAGIEHQEYGNSVFDYEQGDVRERLFYKEKREYDGMGNVIWDLVEYQVDSEDNALENYHITGRVLNAEGEFISSQ